MNAVIYTFNEHSLLPAAAAQLMQLPVASEGLREILTDRYTDALNEIKTSSATPREKMAEIKDARDTLQGTLNMIGECAQGYFRKGQVPADVACALLSALTGDTDICAWKHRDAIKGYALLKCTGLIKWRTMRDPSLRDEKNSDWRKLIFIRQVMLMNELRGSIFELGVPAERVNPRNFPAYRMATEIVWPKSPLSVHVATMASRLRTNCNPVWKRPRVQVV